MLIGYRFIVDQWPRPMPCVLFFSYILRFYTILQVRYPFLHPFGDAYFRYLFDSALLCLAVLCVRQCGERTDPNTISRMAPDRSTCESVIGLAWRWLITAKCNEIYDQVCVSSHWTRKVAHHRCISGRCNRESFLNNKTFQFFSSLATLKCLRISWEIELKYRKPTRIIQAQINGVRTHTKSIHAVYVLVIALLNREWFIWR